MRYWLDTEFNDTTKADGSRAGLIDLISIGIVCQDDRELYLVNDEHNHQACSDWIQMNVLTQLPTCVCPHRYRDGHQPCCRWQYRHKIRDAVRDFIVDDGQPIEIWGFYASYDWVILCQLFGWGNLPKHFPRVIRDLKTYAADINFKGHFRDLLPDSGHHDALSDARWAREAHRLLEQQHAQLSTLIASRQHY